MEKLNLIFEFSVLIDAHSRVRRLRSDVLERGVNADALYEFSVAFKRLQFIVLTLLDAPQYRSAVERA
jgi:hypothetical protein